MSGLIDGEKVLVSREGYGFAKQTSRVFKKSQAKK